jgi:2-polyprenyl-3-methyl-5-hydroxy-6-metoxy-1,4-benzoquinol methylase
MCDNKESRQMDYGQDSGYQYADSRTNPSHDYLVPMVRMLLDRLSLPEGKKRLFDLGCGNGAVAGILARLGWEVTGVDPSEHGISQAKALLSTNCTLRVGSAYDDLAVEYGKFPVVISLEVVEHVYFPRRYAATLYSLVDNGGAAIISTPYHGYLKNLALALTGRMDDHFTALWDHGHIKFWSFRTLKILLEEAGFHSIIFHRVGRIPLFAKSMIVSARK